MEADECVSVSQEEQFSEYTPLQRPDTFSTARPSAPASATATNVEDSEESDEEESSDSDSDSDTVFKRKKAKKPKLNGHHVESSSNQCKKNLDKFKIWSAGLQEEVLTEGLTTNCELKGGLFERTRDVESYNYNLPFLLGERPYPKKEPRVPYSNDEDGRSVPENKLPTNKRKFNERNKRKERERRKFDNAGDDSLDIPREVLDLSVSSDDVDEAVASDIANKLFEPKQDLIVRVVATIGKKKAIEIFNETKKIEADGGMLINNGSRRRTPGGVYLLLLKQDNDITQDQSRCIFEEDRRAAAAKQRRIIAMRRRQKTCQDMAELEAQGQLQNGVGICLNKFTKKKKEEKTMISEDGEQGAASNDAQIESGNEQEREVGVSNPPPSPVTDNQETEDAKDSGDIENRGIANYEDDFLDIHCNDMDIF